MISGSNWTCPYCNKAATITSSNISINEHQFSKNNKSRHLSLITNVTVCPNNDCKEYTIVGSLFECIKNQIGEWKGIGDPLMTWNLKPASMAKQYPDYIPKAIIDDYEEACLIKNLSPKASATLSRRCLQGIIRDFWKISKNRLVHEINEIKERVDPVTWKAIDSIRSIGNIGAHMEKDINLIIDVEPNEAQLLIGLIEMLINDWYIIREERKHHMEQLIQVAESKYEQKKSLKQNNTTT